LENDEVTASGVVGTSLAKDNVGIENKVAESSNDDFIKFSHIIMECFMLTNPVYHTS